MGDQREKIIKIKETDKVAVALEDLHPGEMVSAGRDKVKVKETVPAGHKVALQRIEAGENVIKYGFPIGHAAVNIEAGEHIHTHNLRTNLEGLLEYAYHPKHEAGGQGVAGGPTSSGSGSGGPASGGPLTFEGYLRPDGRAGIRNEVWIIPTVGCVNRTAELLAGEAQKRFAGRVDGIHAFTHPMGCSQLGEDHDTTRRLLAALARHPNAGGVLILSLGCENNNLKGMLPLVRKDMPDYEERIRTLVLQECDDEVAEGMQLLEELTAYAGQAERRTLSADHLVIGLKCGGSDGFSGITANPLCGRVSDWACGAGATAVLTEVPEMFGAEQILMDRAQSEDVFQKIVGLINGFKSYFMKYGQEIYENPSPGNKAGGITTLEDKSLGCIQKGGSAAVTDVLEMGKQAQTPGLNLLRGPGNDMVSCTALTAAGAQMILFTTGRGNPFGAPVPTIKISSNSALAEKKENWIDFDAGRVLEQGFDQAAEELIRYILDAASGRIEVKNERNGYREIVLFKDGVTL